MPTMKEHPRYNVVSLRVTDEEKYILQQFSKLHKTTTSDILRAALALLKTEMDNQYLPKCR